MPKKFGGMDFRKLHDFNLAMLSKQGWNLLTKPSPLVTRLFKARYFPSCSFLLAKQGSNPSYIWSSLMKVQDIIQRGTRWHITDGREVHVLNEQCGCLMTKMAV